MSLDFVKSYLNKMHTLDNKNYIIMLMAYNLAPTIASLKPSSLMVFRKDDKRNTYVIWQEYKKKIKKYFGLDYYELKETKNGVHILFYNKLRMKEILKDEKNSTFLKRFGYAPNNTIQENLEILRGRYKIVCPHEIGIFLGYPISDVIDFIKCPNKKCLTKGYWKVYNDLENAELLFESYDRVKIKIMDSIINNPNKVIVGLNSL